MKLCMPKKSHMESLVKNTMNAMDSQAIGHKTAFRFGANWRRFLASKATERVSGAITALQRILGVTSLAGKRFVDAGSSLGLSSLAARKMGAGLDLNALKTCEGHFGCNEYVFGKRDDSI